MKNRAYFQLLFVLALLLLAGCSVRDVQDDYPAGVIQLKLDWGNQVVPQGKWLVFYPEDPSKEAFSQAVSDEIFIDTLPQGRYRALLLGMNMDISRIDFVGMKQVEQATLLLKELEAESGLYPDAEMVYSEMFSFDLTRPIAGVVMLRPKPLALNTVFEIQIPGAKLVRANLKGIPTEVNLWTRQASYLDRGHYTELVATIKNDRVSLSGMILMPTVAGKQTRADQVTLWLEVEVAYPSGEAEALKVDVTDALNKVAAEAPPEVTFELKKIGLSATIVGWETGTGNGDVIVN